MSLHGAWRLPAGFPTGTEGRQHARFRLQTLEKEQGGRLGEGGREGHEVPAYQVPGCLLPRDAGAGAQGHSAHERGGATSLRRYGKAQERGAQGRGGAAPLRSHRAEQPEPGTESRRPTGGGRRRRRPSGTAVLGLRCYGGELGDLLRRVLCKSPAPPGRVWWNSGLP